METLLAQASQSAQQAEVLEFREESVSVRYEDRELKKIQTNNTAGVSLRLIKDGRLGSTCGTPPLDREGMIKQVITSARYGDKVDFSFPSQASFNKVKTYDKQVAQLSIKEMCQVGATIIKKINKLAPDLAPDISISKDVSRVTMINSNGLKAHYDRTGYAINAGIRIKGSKTSVSKWDLSGKYFEFPDQKIEDLVNEYRLCENQHSASTKKMPVIFTSQATWSLLYRVYAAINGDAIYRGISPLGDKVNTKIFDERINIIDNPTMDFGVQTCPCDDEGVPTYQKNIIDKGVLKGFIFDLATAAKTKTKSTGNGFKKGMWGGGVSTPPGPGVANFTLAPGTMPLKDMIKDMKQGIVVDEVIGFHSGNIIQGEFSMTVGVGYWVEQGVMKARVMDAMVAGNIYDSFNNLVGLGKDVEITFMGYLPAMYFKEMSVAGK